MNSKLSGLIPAYYILLIRSLIGIFGCIAVWWGIVGFPVFWQQSSTGRIASGVIAGHSFKLDILTRQLAIIDSLEKSAYCYPAARQSAAIIQLRMVEVTTSKNDRKHIDENLKSLDTVIRSSLSCAPADPFLWLVLYWVESTENRSKLDYLKYLRISYQYGQNEGWIALKRNRVAFAMYEQLPPELAQNTIDEFIGLIKSKLIEQATEIFTGPAWPERNLILSRLVNIPVQDRQIFADALHKRGYDINVPGVARRDAPL